MAKLYLKLILAKRKNFEDVPKIYFDEVKKLIIEEFKSGNLIAREIYEKYFGGDQLD